MSRFRNARVAVCTAMFVGASMSLALPADAQSSQPARDIKAWPFRWDSIWNMPIGSGAQYVSAGFGAPSQAGMTADEDVIILEPSAPQTEVRLNTAGWDPSQNRCTNGASGRVIASLPIPPGFSTNAYLGSTPNQSAAVLNADGNTLHQSQPFHVCNGYATSQYIFSPATLDGDGQVGAHGGSALSSLGGTLRVGELRPGSGPIRHALKLNLDMQRYGGCRQDGTPCYRWPALQADSMALQTCVAGNVYGGGYCRGTGTLEMGSLLALPPGFDISSLTSAPARQLATALRDYGAYAADATGWDVFGLMTEWGPAGRFIDQFALDWGHPMVTMTRSTCASTSADCVWATEMAKIIQALSVVENNGPSSIGGPGTRIAACAPAFADGTGGGPSECSAPTVTSRTSPPAVKDSVTPTVSSTVTTNPPSERETTATTATTATPATTVGSANTSSSSATSSSPATSSSTATTVLGVEPNLAASPDSQTATPSASPGAVAPISGSTSSASDPAPVVQAPIAAEAEFVIPTSTAPANKPLVTASASGASAVVPAEGSVQLLAVLAAGSTQPEELALTGFVPSGLGRTALLVFLSGVLLTGIERRRPARRRR
jgi:hypothetical protein